MKTPKFCFGFVCLNRLNNLASFETGFKLLADGWIQMKDYIKVFLILFSAP